MTRDEIRAERERMSAAVRDRRADRAALLRELKILAADRPPDRYDCKTNEALEVAHESNAAEYEARFRIIQAAKHARGGRALTHREMDALGIRDVRDRSALPEMGGEA